MKEVLGKIKHLVCKRSYSYPIFTVMNSGYNKIVVKESKTLKDDFQSVLHTLESLLTTFVLFHVRNQKM